MGSTATLILENTSFCHAAQACNSGHDLGSGRSVDTICCLILVAALGLKGSKLKCECFWGCSSAI